MLQKATRRDIFVYSFHCEKVLCDHKNYCVLNKPAKIILPSKNDIIVEFKNSSLIKNNFKKIIMIQSFSDD